MAEVLLWNGLTSGFVQPNSILESAKDKLAHCILIGRTEDNELYVASSGNEAEAN